MWVASSSVQYITVTVQPISRKKLVMKRQNKG